ncbi:hypothetical protein ABH931_000495 [Streptacidiphilus sp. MAP12-33]|uniref:hypothetical protein n=1 Tax=Streptacidiphilus sp. MAP12-33 TaxID=3156266 RepID=UPI0035132044
MATLTSAPLGAPSRSVARRAGAGTRRWVSGTTLRGMTAFPLALVAVPLALTGQAGRAAAWQRAAVRRWSPARAAAAEPRGGAVRVLAHSALVAVPALAGFLTGCVAAFTVYSGYLYFLRPDAAPALGHPFTADHRFDNAWGGPTLVGAWLTHSLVAFGIQLGALLVVHALTAVQDRCTRRMLSRTR